MRRIIGLWLFAMTTLALMLAASAGAVAAENDIWSVRKSSGEVWVATDEARQVSLKQDETLKPGDTIRTGRNGRVLLVRGEETILVAPNSVVGLPLEKRNGLSTTITQQAGSILLDVEKRNVKHFEVETPYLAAVVKGTQFSVTVSEAGTSVDVRRGQVEVSDFKSGQIAQVMPGQTATSFTHGKSGLSLTGKGALNPIEQGKPRASSIERISVPKGGFSAPRSGPSGKFIHALGRGDAAHGKPATARVHEGQMAASLRPNVVRISGALGEVRLNIQKATHGLAHGPVAPATTSASDRNSQTSATVWSDSKASIGSASAVATNSSDGASAAPAGAAAASGVTAAAVTAPASGTGKDNGNGATGNGKGNNGNGNGNGGTNGNGNGNGNGHAYGHTKN
jgi:FecR protein